MLLKIVLGGFITGISAYSKRICRHLFSVCSYSSVCHKWEARRNTCKQKGLNRIVLGRIGVDKKVKNKELINMPALLLKIIKNKEDGYSPYEADLLLFT